MKRRGFITLLGGTAIGWPLSARAQQLGQMRLIGGLFAGTEASQDHNLMRFRDGMRELGYTENRDMRLDFRFADAHLDRLSSLAVELVQLKPNVLLGSPLNANLALKQATSTIPIVMANGADPVGFGLVKSLSRPGGNVTGLTNFADELASKQLDLMRELIPHLSRIAVLVNTSNPLHVPQQRETKIAAERLSIELVPFEAENVTQVEIAISAVVQQQLEALLVTPDYLWSTMRKRIAEVLAEGKVPAIYGFREHVEAGGLMSYGISQPESFHRAATFVDKILKGTSPSDLPVEQPTKIELVINLKAAKGLGLELPATLLARADEVIE
jgi:putative ABC transport system substrate-binding protein